MQFIDRKAKYPGRWTMKKSDGTSEVVTLIRNDEPSVEGTPLNAEVLNGLKKDAEDAAVSAQRSASASASSASEAAKSQTASSNSASAAKASETNAKNSADAANKASQEVTSKKNDALSAISSAKTDAVSTISADVKQVRSDTAKAEQAASDAQSAADKAQVIAAADNIDDVMMLMLVTGRVSFGLYTSSGDVLCTSGDDTLVANGQICKC